MTFEYQREIVSTWFDRRVDGANPFDTFIYTWIALNAALSARYGLDYDRAKVERFGNELATVWLDYLATDQQLASATDDLAALSPIYHERPGPRGERRQSTVRSGDATSVMLGIYAVRNNLFHGAKQFDVERNHVLVTTATRVLERVLHNSGLYEMATRAGGELTDPFAAPGIGG